MSAVSLRIPDSIHKRIREMATAEGISINQLITSALVEKLSSLRAEEYLAKRADRGNRSKFESVLAKVRDRPLDNGDELPDAKVAIVTPSLTVPAPRGLPGPTKPRRSPLEHGPKLTRKPPMR